MQSPVKSIRLYQPPTYGLLKKYQPFTRASEQSKFHMNIRSSASEWYRRHYGIKPKYFRSSKYYHAFESWSKTPCWWFQFPLLWLDEKRESNIIFVGEKASEQNDFLVLKVPIYYFLEKLKGFTLLANNINLMLSAERHNFLQDVRGNGQVGFSQFLINGK